MEHGNSPLRRTGIGAAVAVGIVVAVTWTVPVDAQTPWCSVGFSRADYVVDEHVGQVVLGINPMWRNPTGFGGADGSFAPCEGSVDWETIPGSAEPGEDYEDASGTYESGASDGEPISVVVIDDVGDEPDEDFHVVLSNPQGDFQDIYRSTATVTIDDDDFDGNSDDFETSGTPAPVEAEPDAQVESSNSGDGEPVSTDGAPAALAEPDASGTWQVADSTATGKGVAGDGPELAAGRSEAAALDDTSTSSSGSGVGLLLGIIIAIVGVVGFLGWRWRASLA